ncbi:MAG: TIGR00159 family protein [Geobacter sp.]|nr:TIGR00159 family protein [Geobacter sp.]
MPQFRIQDLLDILIMSILLYQLYSWFRKSRAMQVLAGLGIITAIYFITRQTGLHMTSWVLQQAGTVVIVIIIVVFQNEIRQTLYRFSKLKTLVGSSRQKRPSAPATLAETIFNLAHERLGALLVFQRCDNLEEHLSNGIALDALISAPLLNSIFQDSTPLHDGAVLIQNDRVVQAACLLPLSDAQHLPQQFGTRHRAALGLSERTDAVVMVISEERGDVSLAVSGELNRMHTPMQLTTRLTELLSADDSSLQQPFLRRLFDDLLPKSAVLLGVTLIWFLLSARQGEVAIVPVPLSFHGLPSAMVLTKVYPEEITVRLRATSGLVPSPRQLDLTADIDLSAAREGNNTLRVSLSHVRVPSGLTVVGIEPTSVRVTVRGITGKPK